MMFSLTIVFGPVPTPWVLLFKTKEALDTALQAYRSDKTTSFESGDLAITDDYGATVSLRRTSIHGIMAEDMELSKMNAIERGLHQARTQARAEQMASSDPILKAASMRHGGNAMLSPGFNGAFRQ